MPLYELTSTSITDIPQATFSEMGIKEREDLQRLLRERIEIISPNTLVIAEEFGYWEVSKRRIDLLGVDKDANLVVIELKRTEAWGHMELQAVRYAAMVSTLTFEKAVDHYQQFLESINSDEDAESKLLDFLGWEEADEEEFAQDVRIILASADFSRELTSSVLWLIDHGVDVQCTRLRPYFDGEQIILDVQQIIPLPEAAEYQVQVKEKKQKGKASRKTSKDLTKYDVIVDNQRFNCLPKRIAALHIIKTLCDKGIHPEEILKEFPKSTERLFKSVEGSHKSDTFIKTQRKRVDQEPGYWFNPGRYFTDDDQLIHANGKTYALQSGWGKKFENEIQTVLKAFPDKGIKLERSNAEGGDDLLG